jgi:hypothetical protein
MTISGIGSATATTGAFALNQNVATEVRLATEAGGFIRYSPLSRPKSQEIKITAG